MQLEEVRTRFQPAIDEILDQRRIGDNVVDLEVFQVYMATIWGNAVLEPERSGITEADLPVLHDFLSEEIARIVGRGQDITSVFEFIVSKKGEESLERQGTTGRHTEFLHYFARLILAQKSGQVPE